MTHLSTRGGSGRGTGHDSHDIDNEEFLANVLAPQPRPTGSPTPRAPGQLPLPSPVPSQQQPDSKEKDSDSDSQPPTSIFRLDDEWREKLRLSHEAVERARLERDGQPSPQVSGAPSWERRARDGAEDTKEEPAVDDKEGSEVSSEEVSKV